MKKIKFGFVTILGETNAGKSTLLNTILKEKVSIATRRRNTTRNLIQGIYNDEDSQIVFLDTPGFLKEKRNIFDKKMESNINNSLEEINIILFLVPFWKEINKNYLGKINELKNVKKYLLITQIDRAKNKEEIFKYVENLKVKDKFDKIIPISSTKKLNIENLLIELKNDLIFDFPHFDQNEKVIYDKAFFIKELIREKLLLSLNYEIPHQLFIKIRELKETEDKLKVEVELILEKNSHKGIIIGKNGEMIEKIKKFTTADLIKKYDKKIDLKIIIKVKKDWKNKIDIIGEN